MPAVRNVLIVGGGLAGLALARALGQQQIACDVLEVRPESPGAAISIMNRGVDALVELSLLSECLAQGRPVPNRFSFYNAAGEPLGAPAGAPPPATNPATGYPTGISIERPLLSGILTKAAQALGAQVRLGLSISQLAADEQGVTATFTDGATGRYDLVVGADGLGSQVRSLLFGAQYVPQYTGEISFRWVLPAEGLQAPGGFYLSGRRLVGLVPLAHDRLYVTSGVTLAEKRHIGPDEARAMLADTLEHYTAPPLVALRERLTPSTHLLVHAYDWLFITENWYKGRVLVLGDAAHATTANLASGGGMALEDAVVLAQTLVATEDIAAALAQFQQRRYARTKLVVDTSVELMRMHQQGTPQPEQDALRTRVMQHLSTTPY